MLLCIQKKCTFVSEKFPMAEKIISIADFSKSDARGNVAPAVNMLAGYLQRHGIHSVLLGLSGGVDSTLTFHLLRMAGDLLHSHGEEFRLGIAHVNFQLRGDESIRDEDFVRNLLEKFPLSGEKNIYTHFATFNTEQYCRNNNLSTEMGARNLRHDLFRKIASGEGFDRIATGHNADDNEETLLLNLLRGSGTRGLRGMLPDNGRIIRPLLALPRSVIVRLLEEMPYSGYVYDTTNCHSDYRRNFLRNQVVPLLETRWEGLHRQLQLSLELMAEENKIVDDAILRGLEGHEEELPRAVISSFPSPLTLIRAWAAPHGATTSIAREILAHLATGESGKRWLLQEGNCIVSTPRSLRLERVDNRIIYGPDDFVCEHIIVSEENRRELMAKVKQASNLEVYLPHGMDAYEWTTPQRGDRMKLFSRGTKLVSDILKECGIPLESRKRVAMLRKRAGKDIVWIPGVRRGGSDLIPPDAEDILHIHRPTIPNAE